MGSRVRSLCFKILIYILIYCDTARIGGILITIIDSSCLLWIYIYFIRKTRLIICERYCIRILTRNYRIN